MPGNPIEVGDFSTARHDGGRRRLAYLIETAEGIVDAADGTRPGSYGRFDGVSTERGHRRLSGRSPRAPVSRWSAPTVAQFLAVVGETGRPSTPISDLAGTIDKLTDDPC